MLLKVPIAGLLIAFLILLDQGSKSFCIYYLKQKDGYFETICQFFDLVYVWNYGISFGILSEYRQYSNYALLATNSMICCFLIYVMIKKSSNFYEQFGYILIISGAAGNLVDRISRGAVFDFIYLHYDEYGFPAFNIADSFITIGASLFLFLYFVDLYKNKKYS